MSWCSYAPTLAFELEANEVTANATFGGAGFTQITFLEPFPSVPVVTVLATDAGGNSSDLRIRNVTETGFEVAPIEPLNFDGAHVAMTFNYIAAEVGIHTLPDGQVIVVGQHTTDSVQAGPTLGVPTAFDTVSFGATLSGPASVLATLQTDNSETSNPPTDPAIPWITPIVSSPTASTVQLALERSEVPGGDVLAETIGYIAFPSGTPGTFTATDGQAVNWEATVSAPVILGFDDPCVQVTFSSTPFADARVVATKSSRNEVDGGWFRECSVTSTAIGLQIDEDEFTDSERNHGGEIASLLAFSRSFHAILPPPPEAELTASKTVELLSDPINGTEDPFAIPGTLARYSTIIRNIGDLAVDDGSLVFTDTLPPNTALIVSDFGGPGSGPLNIIDGAPPSGLNFTFGGLGDLTDDIDFSDDNGVSFSYIPIPGADGSDPAVTQFRFRPGGIFQATGPAGDPSIEIEYDVILR